MVDQKILASNITFKNHETIMVAGDFNYETGMGQPSKSFATNNGGQSWTEGTSGVVAGATQYLSWTDSCFIMTGHINLRWGSIGTAVSRNFGKTWEIVDSNGIITMDFLNQDTGYGVCCNRFWPTADGRIYRWEIPIHITNTFEFQEAKLKVQMHPNPSRDQLNITIEEDLFQSAVSVEILNSTGKVFRTVNGINNSNFQIDISDLPTGAYFLRLRSRDHYGMEKFLKW